MSPAEIAARLNPEVCARLALAAGDRRSSLDGIAALKADLQGAAGVSADGSFERAFLACAASVFEPQIDSLPIHGSVTSRLRDEFRFYTQAATREAFGIGSYLFTTGCKVISLRRFPAGPMDWEISGIPRSWLPRIPRQDLVRSGLFLLGTLRGLHPLFFLHVARKPKNRTLLIEKEVLRMYYRTIRSLELQPEVRGIMASAWFHDPDAVAADPHLACLSRPYLENGGLITTTGPAPADAGFLERNAARKEQLEQGNLHYKLGLALWPRRAAIAWAAEHPELED